ncbi:MAG: hypothetical protein LBF24_02280 [Puniceicoccales bacterium]|jgi:cytochrome c556|nr:hypothetical protein [Puniceicoccales bacterium]
MSGEKVVEDEFSEKIKKQIEENNRLIGKAKRTMDEMRAFFRAFGADLDSGHNIFLDSPLLSEESRRQAKETVQKMEEEMKARYQKYREESLKFPGREEPANPFQEKDGRRRGLASRGKIGEERKSVRKIRL